MRWTWHPAKNDWTLADRGFDFEFAIQIFDGRVAFSRTDRDGERRIKAVGMIQGKHFTVIYTKRVENGERVRRVISARRAWDNEAKDYNRR